MQKSVQEKQERAGKRRSNLNKVLVEEKIDIAIVGAGIVGLAVAAELSNEKRTVAVLEKNESFGRETSSRNSEVIHAGIYYPKNSLKAKLCIEGNRMIYEICEKYNVPYKKLGKLIVACDEKEVAVLEELLRNGRDNGVRLEMLDRSEIKKMEPEVLARAAIYSPNTGIVCSHSLMKHFYNVAKSKGAMFAFNSEVTNVILSDGFILSLNDGYAFKSKILINCAGLYADKIAQMVGIEYKIYYCKGDYWRTNRKIVNSLVYPVPTKISLGIHVTPDLLGNLRLGPSAYYIDEISYDVDQTKKEDFLNSVVRFIPSISDIYPDTSGVRPKLQGPNDDSNFKDFIIKHEESCPGMINCIGIDSPGLTAAPAIAKYVTNIVNEIFG